ncbi:MAG: polyketide cyclase [Marmoricola sp.]|nr:polyketide cyclase [Marmoricola sp.]
MKTVRVVTDIASPVEIVWAQLTAISEYAKWNPFITTFRGDLVTGSRLEVRIAPPGGRAMTFRPTITDVVQENRLEWLGRLVLPGLFDGRHSFDLEAVGGSETRLTQAEEFSGLLVPLMGTMLERTRAGFEAMNEALRVRAESSAATRDGL